MTVLTPDVCVVGAGSAGLVAAAGAAQLGLDVVLVERGEMGGDCLNWGCVPSKAMIAAARVAQPTAEAKAEGWRAILDPGTPNETSREMVLSIFRYGQEEVVAPYVEHYLEAAETCIDTLGFHKASVLLEHGFPKAAGSTALLERVDAWLAEDRAPKGALRYVREGRADVQRALNAQARDAQA